MVEPPSSGSESMALSTTEIKLLRNVMSRLDTSIGASSSFAHSGYFPTQKGFKCYHPPSRKLFVSMDVTFKSQPNFSSNQPSLQGEIQDKVEVVSCEDEDEEEIWVSSSRFQPRVPEIKPAPTDSKVKPEKKDKQLLVYERKRLKDKVTATLPPQSLSSVEGSGNPHPIIL
ncbi:hypothetical protein Acr_04g0000150 [Actinidia rufa]|uniref:Retroviral polymerase SH3-like domain-containing protein n=1 Tax=Actinidia rufa TaxID=165716 RepID=A0A7J0EI12_9ERIC|nr:hypothetical protein Acr_04g0000150 [Actinidia rufa]